MNKLQILDGALGSELINKGLILPEHTWSAEANVKNLDIVKEIHANYIKAGADYITTNTFRTTPRAYSKKKIEHNKQIKDYKQQAKLSFNNAIKIAKSVSNNNVQIIGSIAPLEECYSPKLFPKKNIAHEEYTEMGKWFLKTDVDILLLETMNSITETEIAIHALQFFEIPIWISFVLKDSQHLLSGEKLTDALKVLNRNQIKTVMLNCNSINRTNMAMKILEDNWDERWGIYPNLGIGGPSIDGIITNYSSMQQFINVIETSVSMGASILGGCCGSSPQHISEIYKLRARLN